MSSTPKSAARVSETQDPAHQVKFVLSVWRNCTDGRISWEPVMQEFGIPTQGAAAKRLERLLKSHDMKVSNTTKHLPNAQSTGNGEGPGALNAASGSKRPSPPEDGRTPLPNGPKKQRTTKPAAAKTKGKAAAKQEVQNDSEQEDLPIKDEPADEGASVASVET